MRHCLTPLDFTIEELDALFSASEYQTAALMASALEHRGVPAKVISDIKGHSLSALDIESGKHEIVLDEIYPPPKERASPIRSAWYPASRISPRSGTTKKALLLLRPSSRISLSSTPATADTSTPPRRFSI